MTLRELSALASAVFIIAGAIWYVYVAIRGDKVKPVLASWAIISGTMSLSFGTYWTSPNHSLVNNAANAASVIATLIILITVFCLSVRNREAIRFSRFQKWCLVVSGLIVSFWVTIVWVFHGTGIAPYILTQILMFVGYAVTAEKLWRSTKNTESLFTWSSIMLGCAIGLYTAISSGEGLSIIYAGRATVTTATIVWLMCRIERKTDCRHRQLQSCIALVSALPY